MPELLSYAHLDGLEPCSQHRTRNASRKTKCSAAPIIKAAMNYGELCKEVAGVHGNIEVAIVLSRGRLAASFLKSGGPVPDEDEFGKMITQLETVIRTTKANEDKFGELGFIAIRYKYIDGLFFPVNDSDTLVVGIVQPYDHEKVVARVSALAAQEKTRKQ